MVVSFSSEGAYLGEAAVDKIFYLRKLLEALFTFLAILWSVDWFIDERSLIR